MTKEQLERWRSLGFPFDEFYDQIAERQEQQKTKEAEQLQILSFEVTEERRVNEREIIYKCVVKTNSNLPNSVFIEVDGLNYQAGKSLNFNDNTYTTFINIILPVPYANKTYAFTAKLFDYLLQKFVESKIESIEVKSVTIDSDKSKKEDSICFCKAQGLVKTECLGKGGYISDEMYENLAKEMNVDKAIMFAIAKQETKKEPFMQIEPKKATILLERHYVYRLIKKKYGQFKADSCQKEDPSLCNIDVTEKGGYGKYKEQYDRLEKVKKWDETIAVQSCSWGKFQVMGEYYDSGKIYKSAVEFEKAMNLCEIQHFKYFKIYLIEIGGERLIKAMKEKNWEKIAEIYNGKNWKKINPEYAKNLKKYYDEYID